MQQWRLPDKLNEISGLAMDAGERLFAVDDENAVIYELDTGRGRIGKSFALGDPPVSGDFEGIAFDGALFWLVTSGGDLYAAAEGEDGESVGFDRYRTGLGRECEIEGLAQDTARRRLLIACKNPRARRVVDGLAVFAWSIERRALLPNETLVLPLSDIRAALDTDRFNPSGVALDPASGHVLVLASRQRAVAELTPAGALRDAIAFPLKGRHRQPEGIEVAADGRLFVADEGGGHKARLAIYAPRRDSDN